MKLSLHARAILDTTFRNSEISDSDRDEVEELVRMMPDDRVLLCKKAIRSSISNPLLT